MEYVNKAGLHISRLTLGTVALGMNYGISNDSGQPSAQESQDILSAASDLGINTFDTANDYGCAEALIGKYIGEQKNEREPVIVTKFKLNAKNIFNRKQVREEALKSIQASLRSLQIKQVPVVLYHKDEHVPTEILMDVLPPLFAELKKEGLVNITGISLYYPHEIETLIKEDLFQAFQIPMNVFDWRLIRTGMLPALSRSDKIVFIRSVFLQGLFFMNTASLKGKLTGAEKYLNGLKHIAQQEGMGIAQLAFSFVRDTEGITSLIFGAVNTRQIEENIHLLNGPSLSEKARNDIETLVFDIPEDIIVPGKWLN
jgi:aryl-alcohol dehydrogenase-like predicted oxidoreductase